MTSHGFFFSFEGGEGSGKSTQVRLLRDALRKSGREVVVTREPGGTRLAEEVRNVVLGEGSDVVTPRAEALLFAAARAQHVSELLRPTVERGAVVICDRYIDSSVAYQGVARGMGAETIYDLSMWATEGFLPHSTVLLDIPAEEGLRRASERSIVNRMDLESLSFHEAVRAAFLSQAHQNRERFLIVDASPDEDTVLEQVLTALTSKHPTLI